METERTVRVTGRGRIRVRPDATRLTLKIEGESPQYAKAVELSRRDTDTLKNALTAQGFGREDIRTLHFEVEPQYKNFTKNGAYFQQLIGYRYWHTLKVEFPSDSGRLGALLEALSRCPASPEIRISFVMSDPEKLKNRLLSDAVRDAGEKAAVLAHAAGVELGSVLSEDYSWTEAELEVLPMSRPMRAESCLDAVPMDLTPDDIETEDTVTVVWEIRQAS